MHILFGKSAAKKAAVPSIPPLGFQVRENDTYVVSYPRSGNTWMRFLIGNYLTDGKVDFRNANSIIPDTHETSGTDLDKLPSPRLLKSHVPRREEFKNVIYLVRDGRDVAVSYYFLHKRRKKIPEECSFETFLDDFNSGKVEYGTWSNHINSWLDAEATRWLLVRYEDLQVNPVGELIKALLFCKIEVDLQRVKKAVELSAFENMSKLDKQQPRRGIVPSDKNLYFVRKGGSDWAEHFTPQLEQKFMDAQAGTMKRLGYV